MAKAPIAFLAVFVFSLVVAWLLTWKVVVPAMQVQIDTKQGIIERKQSDIDSLSKQLEDANRENERFRRGVPVLDLSPDEKAENEKSIQWQPPELPTNANNISIILSGTVDASGRINGSPISYSVKEIESSNGVVIAIGPYKPIIVRIIKNRLYLDLDVPTKTKPIRIREGKSSQFDDGWDWNGDSKEFEIVDDHLQSVFVETYISSNVVLVQGAIQVGGQVLLLKADFNPYFLSNPFLMPAGRFNVADIGLTTDFEYPSTNNFGKRIGE